MVEEQFGTTLLGTDYPPNALRGKGCLGPKSGSSSRADKGLTMTTPDIPLDFTVRVTSALITPLVPNTTLSEDKTKWSSSHEVDAQSATFLLPAKLSTPITLVDQ